MLIDCDHDLGDYAYDGGDGIKLLDWLVENSLFINKASYYESGWEREYVADDS